MSTQDFVLLISNHGMGKGPEELQLILLGKYLHLLDQNGTLPSAICFYTEGVNLVVEKSPVLDQLTTLEKNGVRLIVCSTCLDYFKLTDQVRVGIVGSMADILDAQLQAAKVITL